jgi:site-specific recombinase XerD
LRPTVAQHLADEGMSENVLHKLLGREKLQTTHFYDQPSHTQVKKPFEAAMESDIS